MPRNPSYLYLRNGIYYFQLRLPAQIFYSKLPANRIIRKSTRTGNRSEALRIARGWWVKIMSGDDLGKQINSLEEMEAGYYAFQLQVERGKWMINELKESGIDPNDYLAVDRFFEIYTSADLEAHAVATNYLIDIQQSNLVNVEHDQKPVGLSSESVSSCCSLSMEAVLGKWVHYNTELRAENKRWSKASKKKFVPQVLLMVNMVGNPSANSFTKELLRDRFADKLPLIPKNLTQLTVFKDGANKLVSYEEVFEIAEEQEVDRLSPRTVQDYAKNITTFLNWAAKKDYIEPNLAIVLEDLIEGVGVDCRDRAFSEDDLKLLFETDEYRKGQFPNYPCRHWIPLIAMYTGCRLGEASQLQAKDIKRHGNQDVWYFNFTDGDMRILKNKGSKREVPVHNDLVTLGLIDYRNSQVKIGEKQLFSRLSPDSVGHWGASVGKWFNSEAGKKKRVGYRERCKVTNTLEKVVTFHSFRHYLVNRSKQESAEGNPKWNYDVWCEITGHSDGTKTTRQKVYEKGFSLDVKVEEMKKLKMDFLDIDSIKKWPKS